MGKVSIPSSSGRRCDRQISRYGTPYTRWKVSIPSSSGRRCDRLGDLGVTTQWAHMSQSLLHQGGAVTAILRSRIDSMDDKSLNPFFIREAL